MTRRSLIKLGGWLISISGAVYLVAFVRALLGDSPVVSALLAPFSALRIRQEPRQFGQGHPVHTARARRRARLSEKVEPFRGFLLDPAAGIVHWTQPAAYKIRPLLPRAVQPIAAAEVLSKVNVAEESKCPVRSSLRNEEIAKTPHFQSWRAPIIREHMALSRMSLTDVRGAFQGLDEAKVTLQPLLSSPVQQCNYRIFELYCRLCCLEHPKDAASARTAFLQAGASWKPNDYRMKWASDERAFAAFHAKTNDVRAACFRRRLASRIKRAKFLLEGGSPSSSGKDTAFRGKGGPNPPVSPSRHPARKPVDPAVLRGKASTSPKRRKPRCEPCKAPAPAKRIEHRRSGPA